MPKRQWDHFEYCVSSFFLSAIMNDDMTGFTNEEEKDYNAFVHEAVENAKKQGFTVRHWVEDKSVGFCRCEVTGLHSDCVNIKLMVYKE